MVHNGIQVGAGVEKLAGSGALLRNLLFGKQVVGFASFRIHAPSLPNRALGAEFFGPNRQKRNAALAIMADDLRSSSRTPCVSVVLPPPYSCSASLPPHLRRKSQN